MVSELFLVNQLPLLKIGIVDLTVRFITQINHASPGMYNTCAVVPSTLLAELEITLIYEINLKLIVLWMFVFIDASLPSDWA